MNLLEETKILLNQYNLRAKKSFGQNFLINESIVDEIVEKSNITNEDVILEIGPGLGTLTKKLLKVAKKVIAVELDQDMCNILKNRINDENLEIINQDILKLDINEITAKYGKIKVVANLPYYITTPIIMKLLENNYKISTITVMVQKEVGERLVASPNGKDYSAITLSVNYYTKSEIIIDVPKENFLP
jgi:16S rRNA (adenine1518-N6/adenine1519-N6)-dimethyltransferase